MVRLGAIRAGRGQPVAEHAAGQKKVWSVRRVVLALWKFAIG